MVLYGDRSNSIQVVFRFGHSEGFGKDINHPTTCAEVKNDSDPAFNIPLFFYHPLNRQSQELPTNSNPYLG